MGAPFVFIKTMQKFADEALIEVSSGKGGNGCVAFRREKYAAMGGPAGGDGGKGGNVVFEVRKNLRTLAHLRYKQSFKAENGKDGEGSQRYGRAGADVIVPVPPGTIIRDAETGELVRDFGQDEGHFLFLKGGNGGWGNVHFKSSSNQAPRKAYPGKEGEYRKLRVELQVMADIGFVGFPNAGKSSLLERFTNARPKIAPYPFTTKIPNLGILNTADRDIILADIPGLLEGASEGIGLGIRFLKHISRTSGLAFLVDLSDDNYLKAFDVLLNELKTYSESLLSKRRVLLGTKMDLDGSTERLEELRNKYPDEQVYGISVFTSTGLNEVSKAFLQMVSKQETTEAEQG